MMQLKQLPKGYARVPIIAWPIVKTPPTNLDIIKDLTEERPHNIKVAAGPTYFNLCVDNPIEVNLEDPFTIFCDPEGKEKLIIIPASPFSFTILKEDEDGKMILFCYEICGVFTDYEFDCEMSGRGD
jgi:hypothetical protein